MPCHDCSSRPEPKGMRPKKKSSSKKEKALRARLDRTTRLLCGVLRFLKEEPGCSPVDPYQGCSNAFDVMLKDIEIAQEEKFECECDAVFKPLVDLKDWWAEHEAADACGEKLNVDVKVKNKKMSKFEAQ